jgi:peptidoglycan/xylan/chitin deacetylase (PgdA/CDA1 family)
VTPRWMLKRTLKWAAELGMKASGASFVYRRTKGFREGLRILTYHKIRDEPEDSYTVTTAHFRHHMAYLADHYNVVDLAESVEELAAGKPPAPNSIAVTFDDGYKEYVGEVSEILRSHCIPATFFLITGILDKDGEAPGGPFLSWKDVRDMSDAGLSMGSHTNSHTSLGEMALERVREELELSRIRIMEELGRAPAGLSYPYGTLRDFSPQIASIAADCGYQFAVTGINGLNHAQCNPYLLRRTSLTAGDGPGTFRMILNGCLDIWQVVDKWGYRLQRPYETDLGKQSSGG